MIAQQDIILIGQLIRTHGKKGELQCRTINTYWDDANADFVVLMLDHIPVPFRVLDWRCKGEDLLFSLKDVADENKALSFIGSDVYMLRQDVTQPITNGLLSWPDLIGYTINGCPIVDIDDSTVNILATLQDGRLIPLHENLITAVDHDTRTLHITIPEGL